MMTKQATSSWMIKHQEGAEALRARRAQKGFTARGVEHLADIGETLFEVVTPDGERIASTTNETAAKCLASSLNSTLASWQEHVGFDAVANA